MGDEESFFFNSVLDEREKEHVPTPQPKVSTFFLLGEPRKFRKLGKQIAPISLTLLKFRTNYQMIYSKGQIKGSFKLRR